MGKQVNVSRQLTLTASGEIKRVMSYCEVRLICVLAAGLAIL